MAKTNPDLPWRRTRKQTPEPHIGRIQKRMARGESLAEAAEGIGIPLWLAKAVFVRSGLPVPSPVRRRSSVAPRRPSDVQVLLAVKLLAIQLGVEQGARGSVVLSKKDYDRLRDPKQHLSAHEVVKRFGTWTRACELAGIPTTWRRR